MRQARRVVRSSLARVWLIRIGRRLTHEDKHPDLTSGVMFRLNIWSAVGTKLVLAWQGRRYVTPKMRPVGVVLRPTASHSNSVHLPHLHRLAGLQGKTVEL